MNLNKYGLILLLFLFFSTCVYIFSQDVLLISFDTESPDNETVMLELLSILEKTNTKATFFVTIEFQKNLPNMIPLMLEQGHEISCHTQNHSILPFANKSLKEYELQGCKQILEEQYNITIKGFRAPYRMINLNTLFSLKKYDYTYDASVFSIFRNMFFPSPITEISTSSYLIFPLDDYLSLEVFHLSPEFYFKLLNNYPFKYKSYSFHPHVIMQYPLEFEQTLINKDSNKITHIAYLETKYGR
ncbi:MAG: polysaccharide deacetylase family protein [Candidatus Nanoarchaeia archaeon]|nr:polysaccharide deacetylase family protein [Candidatus Nanoarchaeia archaeon]